MDFPEAKEADWSKIPKGEILKLNQWFLASTRHQGYEFLLDLVRSFLKSYAKSNHHREKMVTWKYNHIDKIGRKDDSILSS